MANLRKERESNELMRASLQRELESLRGWMVDSWISQADEQELDMGIVSLTAHMKNKGLSENDKQRIDDKISDMERSLTAKWLDNARSGQGDSSDNNKCCGK